MDHDLHSLLAAARDDAPPPRLSIDDITAAGRRLVRRRRRTALLSSVAGGVVAVITGATAAVVLLAPPASAPSVDPNGNTGIAAASQSPARRADFAPAGAFETNYSGYTSGRFVVSDPDLVTAGYQESTIGLRPADPTLSPTMPPTVASRAGDPSGAPVTAHSAIPDRPGDLGPSGTREGRLVVYGPGAFDTAEFVKAERLQVAGREALLRHSGSSSMPSASPAGRDDCCFDATVPTLAWQYLPGAWAAIYWSSFESAPTRDELIALATDMPAGEPRAFPTAIRLAGGLKGYRLIAVSTRTSLYDVMSVSVVRLSMKSLAAPFVAPVELDEYPSIVLTLGVTDPRTAEKLGQQPCPPGSSTCTTLLPDGQYFLQVESIGRSVSSAELGYVLKSVSAVQPANRSAWPPAVSVFTP